jgi:DNA-binding FrmR family transcriptional regulator
MDEKTRADAEGRLKRIAGQVAGIQRMVADDRYCVDILLQIAAVEGALEEVGRVVLANHVETCVAHAVEAGSTRERKAKLDELLDLISRRTLTGASVRTRGASRKTRRRG